MSGEPFPKSSQLARGERRTSRKRATQAEWGHIRAEKMGPCRVCFRRETNGGLRAHCPYPITLHHLVSRSLGGDDCLDNIVPLCGDGTRGCHGLVEARNPDALHLLVASLTEAERAYVIGKRGSLTL